MKPEIDEAITNTKKTIRTKNDAFLVLSSLNLLNAAVKKEEYKKEIGYGIIKPSVAKFIQFCIQHKELDLVDEISYESKGQCAYIRCWGVQFSFHNIGEQHLDKGFIESFRDRKIVWDGIRLQPIAKELYQFAKSCSIHAISDTGIIKQQLQDILIACS
ncbi:MAG: hypothetical protein LIP00_00075 [Parabacteroides sp.]|nr:hypothetical protein [Parabacteroides sp.]